MILTMLQTGDVLPGVVPIVESIGAATLTGYLVGFFKKAFPNASDAHIVAVAILAGLLSATVVSMINGGIEMSQVAIATIIVQGIGAAFMAAGVQATNKPSVDKPSNA